MKKAIALILTLVIGMTIYAGEIKDKTIVTSFYPMYIMTKNITKNVVGIRVVNMTKPQTGCLHDYSLTTDDMKTLERASIFVVNGCGMESFMNKAIKSYPKLSVVEAGKGITTIKTFGEVNPHLWVSVSNAILETKEIAKQLSVIDKKNSEKYNANADEYIKKLSDLKLKMHESIDKISNKNVITFHEAFPYFAKEFNLNIVAVIEREPGSEPSAKELSDTIKTIKKSNVKAIYAEPQYAPKSASIIAKETGVKVYTLDPAVTGEDNLDGYINIMNNNLKVLEESLK